MPEHPFLTAGHVSIFLSLLDYSTVYLTCFEAHTQFHAERVSTHKS